MLYREEEKQSYVEDILAFCAGMLGVLIMLKLSFIYMALKTL